MLVFLIVEEEGDEDDVCNPNPCKNEGECHDLGDGEPFCFCKDGFDGDFCEEGTRLLVKGILQIKQILSLLNRKGIRVVFVVSNGQ